MRVRCVCFSLAAMMALAVAVAPAGARKMCKSDPKNRNAEKMTASIPYSAYRADAVDVAASPCDRGHFGSGRARYYRRFFT